jgi:DNA-binding GntR family transcriptional regulator
MQLANAATVPTDLSALGERIRGDYREMPGLSLSPDQARRLWGLDERTCREALTALVESGFLRRTPKGTFVRTAS